VQQAIETLRDRSLSASADTFDCTQAVTVALQKLSVVEQWNRIGQDTLTAARDWLRPETP
jgi:hypothetical protein